jgi:outer membrane receptor protein involved in Fe transport
MRPIIFFFLIYMIGFSANTIAQENIIKSKICGNVIDKDTKQPLPYVNIWLEGTTTGTLSDTLGNFMFENIAVGSYNISASFAGYKQGTMSDIPVISKKITWISFELPINITQLKEVVVKPEVFSQNQNIGINSINSISNQEISKTPGVPDLFRRLQSVAGISKASDFSPALVVRGSDPEENITQIEGIQIYSPFHFSRLGAAASSDGMSILEPKLAQKVDISTGGFSAKYGDALSSVTEITLSEPEKRNLGGNVSFDMGGISSSVSGSVNNKLSWLWAGRLGLWEMFMKMQGKDSHPQTKDSHLKIVFEPSARHKFTVYFLYVNDIYWRVRNDNDLSEINEGKYRKVNKDMSSIGLTWRWLYNKKGYIQVTPYLNNNNWKMTEGPLSDKTKLGNENLENYYGIKTEFSYRLNPKHRFLIGTEYKAVATAYNKWSGLDTTRNGIIIAPYSINSGKENSFKYSSFAEYVYSPFDWLYFRGGLRQDYFEYINKSTLNPRFGAFCKINDKLRLDASYGVFSQFPQYNKIFLSPKNKALIPGKAEHYILGLEYLITKDLQVKIEVYYKGLKNLPVQLNDTSDNYISTGTGISKGIELTITKKMTENFYLLANYTLSKSTRKDSLAGKIYPFLYDARHTFNVIITYKHSKWWEFSIISRFASGFPYTPYDLSTRTEIGNKWTCRLGEKNSERLPDYLRIDIRIDRKFIFRNWNLCPYLEIWNVTNNANLMAYEYNYDFTRKEEVQTMFKFMPMVGISVVF